MKLVKTTEFSIKGRRGNSIKFEVKDGKLISVRSIDSSTAELRLDQEDIVQLIQNHEVVLSQLDEAISLTRS